MLMMSLHNIHFIEGFGAGRTFAHAVADSVLDTILTEKVATRFEDPVLEVFLAYRTHGKTLQFVSTRPHHQLAR